MRSTGVSGSTVKLVEKVSPISFRDSDLACFSDRHVIDIERGCSVLPTGDYTSFRVYPVSGWLPLKPEPDRNDDCHGCIIKGDMS